MHSLTHYKLRTLLKQVLDDGSRHDLPRHADVSAHVLARLVFSEQEQLLGHNLRCGERDIRFGLR